MSRSGYVVTGFATIMFLLMLAGGSAIVSHADAQQPPRILKWQYGFLVLGDGDPVFTQGRQQFIARPPTGSPGGGISNNGQLGDRVNIVTKDIWNTDVQALDAFGAEGWEAVSMTSDGRRTSILMRRPAP